jgi:hypothetical protein
MTKYFDSGNKVGQDACAIETRNRENASVSDYNTYNYFNANGTCEEYDVKIKAFAEENPNLSYHMGYGVASCKIDDDSRMRNPNMTHGHEKKSLCVRNFIASPDLGKGQNSPNLESILINGVDTLVASDCNKLAEIQFPIFTPFQDCMASYVSGASQILPDRIGKPSKDIFLANRNACSRK